MPYAGIKIAAVVFARTSSSRFVEKMKHAMLDGTVLDYVISRTKKIAHVDTIVVATTDKPEDDWISEKCTHENVNCFRGSENDVAGRLHFAIKEFADDCEIILRVCADNPFLSYELMTKEIEFFIRGNSKLYTPFERNLLPFGFSAVIMTKETVDYIHHNATDQQYREHVENFILETDERKNVIFSTRSLHNIFFPWLSLTFDTEKDLIVLDKVDKLIQLNKVAQSLDNLLDYIRSENYILIAPQGAVDISYIEAEWHFLKSFKIFEYASEEVLATLVDQYEFGPDVQFGDVWFFNSSVSVADYYINKVSPKYLLRKSQSSGQIEISAWHSGQLLMTKILNDVFHSGEMVFTTAVLQGSLGFFISDNIRGLEQGGIWIRQKNKFTQASEFCGFHESQLEALPKVTSGESDNDDRLNSPFTSVSLENNDTVYLYSSIPEERKLLGSLSDLSLPLIWMSNKTLENLSEVNCS